jgi:MFS transporter, DHA1 family, multidrug resistance protein
MSNKILNQENINSTGKSCSPNKHVMFLMLLIPFLMGSGIDLYVPSLPAIADYFHVGSGLVQQTIGFYMLSFGVGQLFLGVLSDIIGRRKIILAGSFCFFVASFLSAYAANIYLLIALRFFQGLGMAGLGVSIRAVARDCFSDKELVKAMTYLATSWALGPIIAPVIGGYLQHYFNWQANFHFLGLYGVMIFIYTFFALAETNIHLSSPHPKEIYRSVKTVVMHPVFLCGSFMLAFAYSILVLFNVIGPFLIQNVLKYSVVSYGHMALLLGLGYFSGSFFNRFLIRHFKSMHVVFAAVMFGFITGIIMLLLGMAMKINLYIILIPVLLQLFVCGLIFPNIMAKIISLFPKQAGTASAVYGSFISLGVFLMTIFATMLKTSSQIPMAFTYVGLFLFCLALFLMMLKMDKNAGKIYAGK